MAWKPAAPGDTVMCKNSEVIPRLPERVGCPYFLFKFPKYPITNRHIWATILVFWRADWILHTALQIKVIILQHSTRDYRQMSTEGMRRKGVQTASLRSDQVTEEGGEQYEHQGIWNPGQVLQGDVPPQLPMNPFIGWRTEGGNEKAIRVEDTGEEETQKNDGSRRRMRNGLMEEIKMENRR